MTNHSKLDFFGGGTSTKKGDKDWKIGAAAELNNAYFKN